MERTEIRMRIPARKHANWRAHADYQGVALTTFITSVVEMYIAAVESGTKASTLAINPTRAREMLDATPEHEQIGFEEEEEEEEVRERLPELPGLPPKRANPRILSEFLDEFGDE